VVIAWLLMLSASPETHLTAGRDAYEALEYEAASFEFMSVTIDPAATEDQRLQAHLGAGMANRIIGRDTDARLNFLYVLKRRPDHALPADAPPKVLFLFEAVRQEVLSSAPLPSSTSTAPAVPAPLPVQDTEHADARARTDSHDSPNPGLNPLALSGGIVAGLGAAGLGASLLLVVGTESALRDPTISLDQRATYETSRPVFITASVLMLGMTAVGAGLLWHGTR